MEESYREQGFSLVEIIIAIGLMAGIFLVFVQVIANFGTESKKIYQSSIFEKILISQVLEVRMASFDSIKDLTARASINNYKCDNNNVPAQPVGPETLLYTWKSIDVGLEYCIDIERSEFKEDQNIIDVKFRSLIRSATSPNAIIPLNTKFIVMRRGR